MDKKHLSFDMKIANRMSKNENECYPFSEASINNIPNISIFTDETINKKITEGCKAVLRASMSSKNPYRYGEVGLLISILDVDRQGNKLPTIRVGFKGDYKQIRTDNRFKQITNNRKVNDLVFIHNHPNDSKFSVADIKKFASTKTLIALIVVGNRHNIFTLIKADKEKSKYITEYIEEYTKNKCINSNKCDEKQCEKEAISDILMNTEEFGLMYRKFYRKMER